MDVEVKIDLPETTAKTREIMAPTFTSEYEKQLQKRLAAAATARPYMADPYAPSFFPPPFPASWLLGSAAKQARPPEIKKVVFNWPATIVFWADGSKTVVKCQPGDTYSPETGLAMAIVKKVYGNKGNYNNVFRKWVPKNE